MVAFVSLVGVLTIVTCWWHHFHKSLPQLQLHVHHQQHQWLNIGQEDGHSSKQWLNIRGHILHQSDCSHAISTLRNECVGPWYTPDVHTVPKSPRNAHWSCVQVVQQKHNLKTPVQNKSTTRIV